MIQHDLRRILIKAHIDDLLQEAFQERRFQSASQHGWRWRWSWLVLLRRRMLMLRLRQTSHRHRLSHRAYARDWRIEVDRLLAQAYDDFDKNVGA